MSKHRVSVVSRLNNKHEFINVDQITLIDDESHGPGAIGGNLDSGEVRLLISSPAVLSVRIEAV